MESSNGFVSFEFLFKKENLYLFLIIYLIRLIHRNLLINSKLSNCTTKVCFGFSNKNKRLLYVNELL